MSGYPRTTTGLGHIEAVARRIRGTRAGSVVVDSTDALYRWDKPFYPQYYIPVEDIDAQLLTEPQVTVHDSLSPRHQGAYVHIAWKVLDAWFEEDEQVFVHPRNPYVRVDAIRSGRRVEVSVDGQPLASSAASVMVFETGLPTRFYLDRTDIDWTLLTPSPTVTSCPYKGVTSDYWSMTTALSTYTDLAWSYQFPTRELLPIAGLVAFYNEKVDIAIDGTQIERPSTHFS